MFCWVLSRHGAAFPLHPELVSGQDRPSGHVSERTTMWPEGLPWPDTSSGSEKLPQAWKHPAERSKVLISATRCGRSQLLEGVAAGQASCHAPAHMPATLLSHGCRVQASVRAAALCRQGCSGRWCCDSVFGCRVQPGGQVCCLLSRAELSRARAAGDTPGCRPSRTYMALSSAAPR